MRKNKTKGAVAIIKTRNLKGGKSLRLRDLSTIRRHPKTEDSLTKESSEECIGTINRFYNNEMRELRCN